jgi:hypothetical protein
MYFRDSFLPVIPLHILKKKLRTGDVVAYTQAGFKGRLVKIFSKEAWIHLGLVWRRKTGIYVVEFYNDLEDREGKTLRILSFEDWCSRNSFRTLGVVFTGQRKRISEDFFIKNLLKYINVTVEENILFIWLRSLKRKKEICFKNKMSCSEFVSHMLQDLGILRKDICPCCFLPWEIFSKSYSQSLNFTHYIIETQNILCF